MSLEMFQEYRGINPRDGVAAAAVVAKDQIRKLSQFTGGTAVSKTVPGGSIVMVAILLHGETAKIGDYVVALDGAFVVVKKDIFDSKYVHKGPLRDHVV